MNHLGDITKQKMTETIETKAKRPEYILSREDLVKHLQEVGKAIITDAEQIAPEPRNVALIEISAEIAPLTEVTRVKYTIHRNADPRVSMTQTHNTREKPPISPQD